MKSEEKMSAAKRVKRFLLEAPWMAMYWVGCFAAWFMDCDWEVVTRDRWILWLFRYKIKFKHGRTWKSHYLRTEW